LLFSFETSSVKFYYLGGIGLVACCGTSRPKEVVNSAFSSAVPYFAVANDRAVNLRKSFKWLLMWCSFLANSKPGKSKKFALSRWVYRLSCVAPFDGMLRRKSDFEREV